MTFKKFTGAKDELRARPDRMTIGQVVIRKNIKRDYLAQLKMAMRKAMKDRHMEFSVGWDGADYAIRRDK